MDLKTRLYTEDDPLDTSVFDSPLFQKYVEEINTGKKIKTSSIGFRNIIYLLDYSYHVLGKSLVSDDAFDTLLKKARVMLSDIKLYSSDYQRSISLPYPMPSLVKVYDTDKKEINKRLNNTSLIVLSSKLDGVSCLLVKKRNVVSLYTKGNGSEGRSITHILPHINLDHSIIPDNTVLRGELIIERKKSEEFSSGKALRSQVIGLINRDPSQLTKEAYKLLGHIDLIFYQVVKPKRQTQKEQFDYISKIGLETPMYCVVEESDIKPEVLSDLYKQFVENEPYDLDGVVVADGIISFNLTEESPQYSTFIYAYKENLHFYNTTVKSIDWSISKDGRLTPVLNVEPVKILNNLVSKVTGHNAKNVVNLGCGIGAEVSVTLSGNIIPYIVKVIKTGEKLTLPPNTYWDGVHLKSNDYSIETIARIIERSFEIYKIKGFAIKTLMLVISHLLNKNEEKIYDIVDFISRFLEYKKENPGCFILGKTKDVHMSMAIDKMCKTPISIKSFMVGTNLFKGFNISRMELVFKEYPRFVNILLMTDNEFQESKEDIAKELLTIESVGSVLAKDFVHGVELFRANRQRYDNLFNISYTESATQDEGKLNILFSGVKQQERFLVLFPNLYTHATTMSRKIDFLVIENKEAKEKMTGKMSKALEYGIKIITVSEFYEMMNSLKVETPI